MPFPGTSSSEATHPNGYHPLIPCSSLHPVPFCLTPPLNTNNPRSNSRSLITDSHKCLKIGCWNCRGWPLDSNFRRRVIKSLELHLIGVCETFLHGNNELQLDGYTWLGNNRKALSKGAIRGSGGVGLFIRDSLFLKYSVSILDSISDSILWVLLLDQSCNQSITICICYLPPSNSSRGGHLIRVFQYLKIPSLKIP